MRCTRLVPLALVFALSGLFGAGTVHGQGQTTGSIRGEVVSTDGAAVVGAEVVAVNRDTGLRRAAVTNAEGRFSIPLLPPGVYTVRTEALGFAPFAVQGINVRINEATPVTLRVSAQAVALEAIEVTAGRARIDPSQGGVVQTITPEQVDNLPTAGRDFTDLIKLSPLVSPQPGTGTGGQFSIAGARTSGTNVQIDGTDANNVFFGENRGSSRTPFAFSLESIKEFQLITNGFDVEYGNYQGGVVNAVTKGGTNELRGTVFGFFRDAALTGDDFNGEAPIDYSVQQFGASLSGPIVRDKLHFFASVDAQLKDQPLFALTPEASGIPQAVITDFQNALEQAGFPNAGNIIGQTTQAEDNLVLFGRLDWTINDQHRLTVRQNYSDFEQTNDRIGNNETLTRGGPFLNTSYSTVVELNSVLGRNAFNTFRFQYSDEDRPRNPNEPGGFLPEIRIDDVSGSDDIFTGGDGIIFRNRLIEDKLQFIDNFTYQAGSHTIKVGTNNLISNTTNTFFLFGNGSFRFRSLEDFRAGRPSQFTRNIRACPVALTPLPSGNLVCPELDVPTAEFGSVEWSVYAQDDWRVSDRLLITPGIRFGGTSFDDEPDATPAVSSAFTDPITSQPVRTDFVPSFSGISPRLAFTYDIRGDETNVIRGGVGLLIGRAPTVLVGNVFQTERPLLSVFCTGSAIPRFNLPELLAGERGANNPAACVGGAAPRGSPEYTFFSSTFELPRTIKANLGYETLVTATTKLGFDFIYSRSEDLFTVRDLNLQAPQFELGTEGRPVFVAQNRFNPARSAGTNFRQNQSFSRVFLNTAEGEARSYNVAVELDQKVLERLQFGLRYAYNNAYDNSSFSCCTSGGGFSGEPTAGDPNFIGDPGDELIGAWGPSAFERRHTIVGNFVWQGPAGFNASGIVRLQSGTPWTPLVDDDINADGVFGNDRAFIGGGLLFASPADARLFEQKLAEFDCLADQRGQIARRNSCRNPWFNSVDLRLAKRFSTFGNQSAEIVADLFNVLNGLNSDWGRFVGVFGSEAELLDVEGYNAATRQIIYSVNPNFGEAEPIGFDPFQFQAQIGIRYRF